MDVLTFLANSTVVDMGSKALVALFVVMLFTEVFEGAFPPAGWTRVENIGSCDWESSATTGTSNQTGGAGLFADANSDWCGDAMDAELWTPAFDLSAAAAPVLSFHSDFKDFGGADDGYVDISTDGGTTWTNLLHYDGVDARGPRRVEGVGRPCALRPDRERAPHPPGGPWHQGDVPARRCPGLIPEFRLPPLKKDSPRGINGSGAFRQQRGHPKWIVPVDSPWKGQEGALFRCCADGTDFGGGVHFPTRVDGNFPAGEARRASSSCTIAWCFSRLNG